MILTSELIVACHGSCSVITIGVKRTLVIDVPLQDWLRPCNVQGVFALVGLYKKIVRTVKLSIIKY